MSWSTVGPSLLLRSFSCSLLLAALGCSYDWAVRADGGPIVDAGGAAADGGDADAAFRDGSCESILREVDEARTASRVCALGAGECGGTVVDSCGCPVFVAVRGSASAARFEAAAREAEDSACALGCSACSTMPTSGTCLLQSGEALCWP
ncbi:MAG: hypothetical protein HY791_10285 [Deltaproteobacteria bacterium]|nr:hypothetical protein [Deltaproteobacteria bacterium]